MIPFIVWLNEEEINELINFIIRSDSPDKLNEKGDPQKEMDEFSKKLIAQNDKLIQLFRKVEPLNPIQKKAAQVHGVKQKCDFYKEHFNSMKNHCNLYSNPSLSNSKEYNDLACNDCPVSQLKANPF